MAPIYSSCLLKYSGAVSGGWAPADGTIGIVRDIDVYCGATFATTIRAIDNDTGGTWWTVEITEGNAAWESWRGRQVFEEGTAGFTINSDADNIDVRVSGYILTAP